MTNKLKQRALSLILMVIIVLSLPVNALAEGGIVPNDVPVLTSIEFNNAKIEQEFDSYNREYTILLDDPAVTPTLNKYSISGDANIYVKYSSDANGVQSGVIVTLKFDDFSMDYKFNYSNPPANSDSGNNNLAMVSCNLCEVYPQLNSKDTSYTLYIPSDLTEITLSVATEDTGANCKVPGTIKLTDAQELTIPLTVIAPNSKAKAYKFKVKRLDKTMEEVKAEMQEPDFKSLVHEQKAYQKTEVTAIVLGSIIGLILLIVFVNLAKKLIVRVYDEDEKVFFENEDIESKSENEQITKE